MDQLDRSFCGARRETRREKRNRLTREKEERVSFFFHFFLPPVLTGLTLPLLRQRPVVRQEPPTVSHIRGGGGGKYDRMSCTIDIVLMRILDTVDSDACALILISEWTSANGY